MPKIIIDGVIGWDVEARDIKEQLDDANGKDVVAEISSPGGFISVGLNIYNLLKNYKGNVDTHLMGQVASMATYIAMVGKMRTAEKNAVFMIHNASGIVWGDHRAIQKYSNHLDSLTNMIGKEYTAKTGTDLKEIRSAMDDETFYYGDEIKEAGFVHEMIGDEDPEDRSEAVAFAQLMVEECNAKINKPELVKKDMKALSTMMIDPEVKNKSKIKEVQMSVKPDKPKQEVKSMNEQEFKEKYPELYNQIVKNSTDKGIETGADQERQRVKTLTDMRAKFPKAHSQKVIDEAIAEGHDLSTLTLNLMAADQAADEVDDGVADDPNVPAGNNDNVPAISEDGEMSHIDHIDATAKKIAALPGVMA